MPNILLLFGYRAKKIFIEYGFSPEKLFVVYNSLNYDLQKKSREKVLIDDVLKFKKKYFKDSSLPLIIFIGRLTSAKKPELVVELANEMNKSNIKINVLIIGDGPDLEKINSLILEYDLSNNVHAFGACHDENKLATFLVGSDLSIVPGFVGLSAMHYMAYGLPVITSDNFDFQKPEFESIIQNKTGSFFKDGDVIDLVKVVKSLLTQNREVMRNNCISMIEGAYNPKVQHEIINHVSKGGNSFDQPAKKINL